MDFSSLKAPSTHANDLKRLQSRHREILRLAHTGLPHVQIAEQLGITAESVSRTVNSELGAQQLEVLEQGADLEAIDVKGRIDALQLPALDLLEKVLSGDIEEASVSLRVKTAQDMLDRGGNGAVKRVEGTLSGGYLVRVGVEEIKSRARDLGYLDVTSEVV